MPPRPNSSPDEILDITLQLIAEFDVSGVSVDMVAAKAEVSKATIYRRWKSRAQLLSEAVVHLRRPVGNPDTGSLRGDLTLLLTELADFVNHPAGGRVYAAFLNAAVRDKELSTINERISNEARAAYECAIQRAIKRGELKPKSDIGLMVDVLISPFLYRGMIAHEAAHTAHIQPLIDIVFAAFGRQSTDEQATVTEKRSASTRAPRRIRR